MRTSSLNNIANLFILLFLMLFIVIIYRLFTTKKATETKNKKMIILSVTTGVFPIMPLAIAAAIAGIATLNEFKFLFALFFLGGPVGLISLILSLLGHTSKINFLMLAYGGISYSLLLLLALYSIVAGGTVAEVMTGKLNLHDTLFNIAIFIYASLNATIFPWHLLKAKKALNHMETSA